jgi:glycosyltransferase involved in cell wall biosynthesis
LRILFLTQYYPPETGAAQNRIGNLTRRLAALGHNISVLTAFPSYPAGRIFDGYRGKAIMESMEGSVRVIRVWCFATKSKRFVPRIINYFSFVVTSLVLAVWKLGKQDFIIVESPPLFLGISGIILSRIEKARLIMNISDLWPESAVALGIIGDGVLLRWLTKFEEYLYRRSELITAQTNGIAENIARRMEHKKVVFLPNGISPEEILSEQAKRAARLEVRQRLGLQADFIVGYTGLHGLAQSLHTVLESAQRLTSEPSILFAFIGDGPEKERLEALARELGLHNVRFCPSQPAAEMGKIFAALDVAIIPLRRHPLFQGALPSKLFEAMGAGLPVIFSGEGEAGELVQRAQAGICVEPENAEALASAILTLFRSPELRQTYSNNGSAYAARKFNRAEIAAQLSSILQNAVTPVAEGMPQKSPNSCG